jgi:hypothetical protein
MLIVVLSSTKPKYGISAKLENKAMELAMIKIYLTAD